MNALFRHAPPRQAPGPARIARVAIFDDLKRAEQAWRKLEAEGAIFTPYQRYDWVAPWQYHVGEAAGFVPFIVVGYGENGEPLFLWPLARAAKGPLKIARFFGDKHANFKLALWQPQIAAAMTRADFEAIFAQLKVHAQVPDLLLLCDQPESWNGTPNPFALLPHQPSPSFVSQAALDPNFEELAKRCISTLKRKKIRNRERALAAHGPVRFWRAQDATDARAILAAFHAQKAERMREFGLANVFAEKGVREFIEIGATQNIASGQPAIEIYALSAGDVIVATCAGVVSGGRFSTMFNSIIRNEMAQTSPGQLLLMKVVQMACERGLAYFDLGVGEARYKELFCDDIEPLFDCFIPLTARGALAAPLARTAYAIKGHIKHNAVLWSGAQRLRRALFVLRRGRD